MAQYLLFILTGLALGFRHALEPDHVAAVGTMVSHKPGLRKSSLTGALWGVGHSMVLLVVGIFILVLQIKIPDQFALAFELLTGLVLISLGGNLLVKLLQNKIHIHTHHHGDLTHTHFHSHEHSSAFLGALHGLAGSGTLMFLILAKAKTISSGLLFILAFGLGSTLGMVLASAAIGQAFAALHSFPAAGKLIYGGAALFSIIIGLFLIFATGKSLLL